MATRFHFVLVLGMGVVASSCGNRTDADTNYDESHAGGTSNKGGTTGNAGTTMHGGTTGNGGRTGSTTPPHGGSTGSGGTSATAGGSGGFATSCQQPSDCTLTAATCCGTCGIPQKTDVVAVATAGLNAYRNAICGSGPKLCPLCATMNNPDLLATCDRGTCSVVDLTESPLSACSRVTDCRLRAATCCECGASMALWDLVALSSDGLVGYAAILCDAGAACPECMPHYPTNAQLSCTLGHCSLARF